MNSDRNEIDTDKTIGVIGAGSFGMAIANLLAEKHPVLLYTRKMESVNAINTTHFYKNQKLHDSIKATNTPSEVTENCTLIFPIVSSNGFKAMLTSFKPHLTAKHILIHGTKGLHLEHKFSIDLNLEDENVHLTRADIKTMSELIASETKVEKIGCLAGPNLAVEINDNQLAATVIASHSKEVITVGKKVLACNRFKVFGSKELIGVELAGVLKNYIAIAAGMASGLGYGDNAKAFLITRGMSEMISIANSLGYNPNAFLGIAGIGDLIATCNSKLSRNFRVGYNLAQGKSLEDIISEIGEVAEGVKTLQLVRALKGYDFQAPIANVMHRIIFKDFPIQAGINFLMNAGDEKDVAFLD